MKMYSAEPEKKSDKVRRLTANGEYRKALQIAKEFRLGTTKEDRDAMRLGYECMLYPEFFRQVGKDTRDAVRDGVAVLVRLYGRKTDEEAVKRG